MAEAKRVVPSLALVAHGEALLARRRVLVIGDSFSPTAESLVERGARLVEVRDPDAGRVAEAATRNPSRHITYAPLALGSGGVRDGAYDLAIVENLAMLPEAGPRELLKSLRKALSIDGVAYIASPNPSIETRLLPESSEADPPEYYELFDLVGEEFEHVRMLGLAPYVGYSVFDFGVEEDPAVSLDPSFIQGGAEEPEWFVALASQDEVACDEFTVVQLPCEDVLATVSGSSELRAARELARSAERRVAQIEARSRRAIEKAELDAAAAREEAQRSGSRRETAELEKQQALIGELEARTETADARADHAAELLDAEEKRTAEQKRVIQRLERQLESARDDARERREADRRGEKELAEAKRKLTSMASLEGLEDEMKSLEERLGERAARVRTLETELREGERIGRELLAELELLRTETADGWEPAQVATLEADLAEARWAIRALQGAGAGPKPDAGGEASADDASTQDADAAEATANPEPAEATKPTG